MWGENVLDNLDGFDNIDDIMDMPQGGDGFSARCSIASVIGSRR
jgi:hypothetical protein